MAVQAENVCPLSSDIFYDILRRLDGATLASAACVCAAFSTISEKKEYGKTFVIPCGLRPTGMM